MLSKQHRRLPSPTLDQVFTWAGMLVLWEVAVRLAKTPVWLLPAPSRILQTLVSDAPRLWLHTVWTVGEAVSGLLLAIVFSLLCAALMDRLPRVKNVLLPLLAVTQAIPIVAIAPLLLIWLGYGVLTKVAVVMLICFFPLVTNLMDAFTATPAALTELFRSHAASPRTTYRLLKLPAALPNFFSGLRIAATYAMIGAVFAEWLGAQYGLGIYLFRSAKSFATAGVFAAIILLAIFTLLLFGLVNLSARRAMPWYYLPKGENS